MYSTASVTISVNWSAIFSFSCEVMGKRGRDRQGERGEERNLLSDLAAMLLRSEWEKENKGDECRAACELQQRWGNFSSV
jgi:hypothetical protein